MGSAECGVRNAELKPDKQHESSLINSALRTPYSALLPKVADFGLARFLESAERPTQTGEVFGTPEFMAPEQATGDQHGVGPETDVWALGVILYELLTGRVPFVGTTPMETMELVRRSPAVSPELVRPGVPRELAAVCLKCLEKLPYRRYHTAAALRDDLDRFLAGQPVSALPRSRWGRLLADIRRNPWVAIRWTLAVGVILVLLGIIGWQQVSTRSEATTNTAELAQLRELHESTLRELYAARIALAEDAIDENRLMDAEKWLTLCRPKGDDPDERSWEWNYLSNRLRGPAQIELRLADASRHGFEDVNLIPNAEATSPDRRRRVVLGPTGRLMVYDREGRLLMQMPEVPGRTVGVRFSKDGRWLAIRTDDDTVVAFDGAAP
ncbi:MAG: serine/threonine-protein kinase [Gemmataceae bacterium]